MKYIELLLSMKCTIDIKCLASPSAVLYVSFVCLCSRPLFSVLFFLSQWAVPAVSLSFLVYLVSV